MSRAVIALARRAIRNVLRRPQFLAPLVIFPSLLLAVNVGGLSHATQLKGFPPKTTFLQFQLGAAITQSLLLGGVSTGIAIALEIEGGFFDRLIAAPIPRISIIFGRLAAASVIACIQVAYFVVLGLIFGADIRAGLPGVLIALAIGGLAGTGFGAIGVMLALRAKSASVVQGIFPLVFVVLFISSAFFPRDLLTSPTKEIARYNPLSYVADGIRSPIIHSVDWTPILEGFAAAAAIALVATAFSVLALRGRLRDA